MSDAVSWRVDGLAVYDRPAAPPQADAPTVVLVHGSMDRGASFAKAGRRLTDLHVVRYDRRGYGRSVDALQAEREGSGIGVHVDDLTAIVDRVESGQGVILVGHSFGGVVALAVAERCPAAVRSVGAFEAPMPWTDWWPSSSAGGEAVRVAGAGDDNASDAAERFMRRMIGDAHWERLPAATRAARRAEGPALLDELHAMRDTTEPPYDLAAIAPPVVSGHGTLSHAHHIEAARRLAAGAGSGQLVVVDGAGHGAHYSHPVEFAAFVRTCVQAAIR